MSGRGWGEGRFQTEKSRLFAQETQRQRFVRQALCDVIDDDPQPPPEEIDQARGVIFNANDQRNHSARLILHGLKSDPPAVRCAAAPHSPAHHFPTDARPLRVARYLPLIEDQHIADDGCAHGKHLAALDGVKDTERHAPHGAEIIVGQLRDERGIQRRSGRGISMRCSDHRRPSASKRTMWDSGGSWVSAV